ncbi:MAG: hypothetical protein N5P05_004477 (plasmid) [Chroococcopsis gigantea SAG 12.99]|nr:hypothetical protein [Chroococcopsis gigantea SAG 12.99]
MSTERALAIENQIKISIMIILQENPDWEKYADWQKPLSGQLFIPDIGVNRRFLQPGAISG